MAVRHRLGGGIGADDAARSRPVVDDDGLAQRSFEVRGDQARHHVVEPARGERDDQANGTAGVCLGVSTGRVQRDEPQHQKDGETESASIRARHGRAPAGLAVKHRLARCRSYERRHHAASFFISPTITSPISAVVTILAPSDLMSAVRSPCASAAAIAASIRSASLAILSE